MGKTCAALCLCDHVPGAIYETEPGFVGLMHQAQDKGVQWYNCGQGGSYGESQIWHGFRQAPLVVIDELGGREKVSDFQYRCLLRLLDEREGVPTVLVSNVGLALLGQLYDDRVVSRLGAGTVVEMEGPDKRINKS